MDYAETSKIIVDALKAKEKNKTKFYFNDLAKIIDAKPREAKKIVTKMVEDGLLVYWSSGSTTMYSLPGAGKQAAAEHED